VVFAKDAPFYLIFDKGKYIWYDNCKVKKKKKKKKKKIKKKKKKKTFLKKK